MVKEKLNHACKGGLLGALLAVAAFWWISDVNWTYVTLIAAVCATMAYVNGEGFILWLRQLWHDFWSH